MLTRVEYSSFPRHVLAKVFPEVDPECAPLYADDAPGARARFEFDERECRVIHPVDGFGDVPVLVHEFGHYATLLACGFDLTDTAPKYRLEAAAMFGEQALALNFPVYLPAVYERLYTKAGTDIWGPLSDALRRTIAFTPLGAMKMIVEGQHG